MESSNTLEASQYRRDSGEKPKQPGVRRVALGRIIPTIRIEAEEQLDILEHISTSCCTWDRITHAHGIRLRTVHVSKEEVTKLDRVETREKKTPLYPVSDRSVLEARDFLTLEYAHHFLLLW